MSHSHRHGGVLAGFVLTVLILGALAMTVLVATGVYVHVTHDTRHHEAALETPFGGVHLRESAAFDPKFAGVPVYPGAVRQSDRHKLASLRFDFGDTHKDFAVVAGEYRTYDSVDKVTEFYRRQLPHWMFSHARHGGTHLELNQGGYRRMVAIYENDGETRIALASMGEPASN